MMNKSFAVTLEPGTSLENHTGSWRTLRPVNVFKLPPCNKQCPAGENISSGCIMLLREIMNTPGVSSLKKILCLHVWAVFAITPVKANATAAS